MVDHTLEVTPEGVKITSWDYTILIPQPLVEGQIPSYQPGRVIDNVTGEVVYEFTDAKIFIESAELLKDALVTRYGNYK